MKGSLLFLVLALLTVAAFSAPEGEKLEKDEVKVLHTETIPFIIKGPSPQPNLMTLPDTTQQRVCAPSG